MSSLNKVIIIGNLGRDPEIRSMQNGDKVANLSLATSESWKDRDGNKQEKTEWHRVVIFGKLAEICERYLKKGTKILVEGKLQTKKWVDQNGNDKYTTEIILSGFNSNMVMLGGKNGNDGQNNNGYGGGQTNNNPKTNQQVNNGTNQPNYSDDLDDDIPF